MMAFQVPVGKAVFGPGGETGLATWEGQGYEVGGVLGHTTELGRSKPRRIALKRPPSFWLGTPKV